MEVLWAKAALDVVKASTMRVLARRVLRLWPLCDALVSRVERDFEVGSKGYRLNAL